MPIYEYLCPACNRIYSFLSRTYDPAKVPTCPKCGATNLTKEISKFAFVRTGGGGERKGGGDEFGSEFEPGEPDAMDNPAVEREMMKLLSDAEHMDENDPRQLGRLMRRMSEITGEPLEGEMEEAVRRLELGEDPDKIEDDLGDVLGDDFGMGGMGGMGSPSYDEGLYPM